MQGWQSGLVQEECQVCMGADLFLVILSNIAKVQVLAGDVHKLEVAKLADVVQRRLIDGLCQVQHLHNTQIQVPTAKL